MLHPAKGRVSSPSEAARDARRELARLARPAGDFDASRYFRDTGNLGFYNVAADRVRALARTIMLIHRDTWTLKDALSFADRLIRDRYLEVKGIGIEVLARYRADFTPSLLPTWKGWLADDDSANWATTDAICGMLIGPLLVADPRLARQVAAWSSHRSLWVRRASIVSLIPLARKGTALDTLYGVARRLHRDREDLIQKAVGWALREAGKADMNRLEQYLTENGPRIPRTTLRYAIERFPAAKRRELLTSTKAQPSLLQKLGVKPQWRASVLGIADQEFVRALQAAIAFLSVGRTAKDCDAIFLGATKAAELGRMARLKASLKPDGALWVVRPKGRPEISEAAVMQAGKTAGLVDVKVVSLSATHTAEKFVIPVSARRSAVTIPVRPLRRK